MENLETWLQNALAEASRKFPDVAFFLMAVEGTGETSAASNIPRDQVNALLSEYVDTPARQVTSSTARAN